jgi:L-asparaginase II
LLACLAAERSSPSRSTPGQPPLAMVCSSQGTQGDKAGRQQPYLALTSSDVRPHGCTHRSTSRSRLIGKGAADIPVARLLERRSSLDQLAGAGERGLAARCVHSAHPIGSALAADDPGVSWALFAGLGAVLALGGALYAGISRSGIRSASAHTKARFGTWLPLRYER